MSVAGCSKEYIRYCSSLISIIITLTDYLSSFVFTFQLYSDLLYYSTLIYSDLLYSTLIYSDLLYSTLLFSDLLYSDLLYSTLLREAAVSFTGPRFDNRSSKEYFEEECFCPDAVEKVVNHHTLSLFLQEFSAFLHFYHCTSTTFTYLLILRSFYAFISISSYLLIFIYFLIFLFFNS